MEREVQPNCFCYTFFFRSHFQQIAGYCLLFADKVEPCTEGSRQHSLCLQLRAEASCNCPLLLLEKTESNEHPSCGHSFLSLRNCQEWLHISGVLQQDRRVWMFTFLNAILFLYPQMWLMVNLHCCKRCSRVTFGITKKYNFKQ